MTVACASTAPSNGLRGLIDAEPTDRVCPVPDVELSADVADWPIQYAVTLAHYRRCRESYEALAEKFDILARRFSARR